MNASIPLLLAAIFPAVSVAQTPPAPSAAPASEPAPAADLQVEPAPAAAALAKAARPLGWLSDPKSKPDDLLEALISGKFNLDNNTRVELADTTGKSSSTAMTNRLRFGYETKPFGGFSATAEFENVVSPDPDNYYVPQTGDGTPTRTTVADPQDTELNQLFLRYMSESVGDSGVSLDFKAGRQRIKLDDDRFIGNVGWRQFETTYDAISLRSNLGVKDLSVFYAYVWGVQRIFGPDGNNPSSTSHLINASYKVMPELKITPFVYLLDFDDDEPANSSNNFGVRFTGDIWKDADQADDVFADYELTYAHQVDAGDNPVEYEANFFAAQARLTKNTLGFVMVGYQLLGSDNGVAAFRFPLGTNHAFQGFADNFLVTPNVGLHDAYVGICADLFWGIKSSLTYHQYWSDQGSEDFGEELNAILSKQINPNWSVLFKGAYYDGDTLQPDTTRFWFQTTFKF